VHFCHSNCTVRPRHGRGERSTLPQQQTAADPVRRGRMTTILTSTAHAPPLRRSRSTPDLHMNNNSICSLPPPKTTHYSAGEHEFSASHPWESFSGQPKITLRVHTWISLRGELVWEQNDQNIPLSKEGKVWDRRWRSFPFVKGDLHTPPASCVSTST